MILHGRRATVMGLGHFGGGVAAARWLARHGAIVTVTDTADECVLADALKELGVAPIAQWHLGGHHEEDFRHTDLVVVNPAVRPGNRCLEIARQSGARLTTEVELFLDACPAQTIGVTGSNGKSTTAAMTASILRASGRRTWLGGNIGGSLLDDLDRMQAEDWVVLELSSFQLWYMNPQTPMPHIAVVTNCTPNHLDWHGCFEDYAAAKQRLLAGQSPEDLALLNRADPEVDSWQRLVRGRRLNVIPSVRLPKLPLPGEHNRVNAAFAATAALGAGCDEQDVRYGLDDFPGLPQRLQLMAVIAGQRFYNDSAATTPESTMVALRTLEGPLWLLAGGSDKGTDFEALADAIVRDACGAAFFGMVRHRLQDLVKARSAAFFSTAVETLPEALAWCWSHSRSGDSIVLSPACASKDQFQNYRQRGEKFVELIRDLAVARAQGVMQENYA
jgi:UDP-N-acetylmuramoylalanine--D-glutamate ligase